MADFNTIYNEYFKDVYRYMLVLSHDKSIAEEITQETFFKALKGLKSFNENCDVRVWLCQIAKNSYYTYCKKQNRLSDLSEIENYISKDNDMDAVIVDKESVFELHKIIHNLEEPYKEVFSLRVFGELTFLAIGNLFGKNESWARVTFYRAKNKIIDNMRSDTDD